MTALLPTDLIDVRVDARAVDAATVAGLAESIASVGLINPIRVRPNGDRWEVVAGVHRLLACKQLGLAEIESNLVTDDDLHAELAMIDENLCRAELSPSDRARQTARRKAIYEELHPETRLGENQHTRVGQVVQPNFASATATVTGADARTVRRDAERGEKVIAEVLDLIKGTKLDTGTYLDKLKGQTPNEQFKAAKRDLAYLKSIEREKTSGMSRRFKPAIDPEDVTDKQFNTLMSAWNNAGADARERFLAAIDTPVMDRSAA